MSKILVLVGSARQTRAADKVLEIIKNEASKLGHDISVADQKELQLPIFDEAFSPSQPEFAPTHEGVLKLTSEVGSADAVLALTPEYNHGTPAALKNMIDWVYKQWEGKKVGFVGYGWGGAPFSRKHLHDVFAQIKSEVVTPEAELIFMQNLNVDGSAASDEANSQVSAVLAAL
jgi:NAD(P)H-dependent FMN reductase